jgi:hypothetical protein
VFKRAGHLLLILALLSATGAQWALLQSVAWATMLASNSQKECLSDAVSQTFDGRHPCPICLRIAKARQAEQKSDVQTAPKNLEFSHEVAAFFVSAPDQFHVLGLRDASAAVVMHTPPTPPPRETPA